jgi:hypothetical protein
MWLIHVPESGCFYADGRVHAQVTMLLEEMERLGSRQNTFHALNILE